MYNICIIDDAFNSPCIDIGIDEKLPLCSYTLKKALESNVWSDTELKSLIEELLKKTDFSLKGYSNPEFFNNDIDYTPDIVIFDWDYGSLAKPSEEYLKGILEKTFCMVYIYTGCDKKEDIKNSIKSKDFINFNNRIDYFEKEEDSVKKIDDKVNDLKQNNFSFKFGKRIRQESQKSVENILVNLGKIDIEKAQKALNISGSSSRDLIEFIGERYKNLLLSINFSGLELDREEPEAELPTTDEKELQQDDVESALSDLWKYRLYFDSNDIIVRKGDIIKWDENYFMVLTPDCDLVRFWSKTLGYINLIRLFAASKDKELINKMYLTTRKINSDFRKYIKGITSLSNALSLSGAPLFFPFIDETDCFLFPKTIESRKIEMPDAISKKTEKEKADIALKYDMIPNAKKITSLSEPFLTAVIEHIFKELKGYGSPDYNEDMKKELTENAKGVFKSDS